MGNAGQKWWDELSKKRKGNTQPSQSAGQSLNSGSAGQDWWQNYISTHKRPAQKEEMVQPSVEISESQPKPTAEQANRYLLVPNAIATADGERRSVGGNLVSQDREGVLGQTDYQKEYDYYESEAKRLEKEWQDFTDNMPAGMPSAENQQRLDELKGQYEDAVRNRDAAHTRMTTNANLKTLASWPEEDRQMLIQYALNEHKGRSVLDRSSQSATRAATALVELRKKYDMDTIDRLAESYQWYQNEIATKTMQEEAAKEVDGKAGAAIVHSGLTIPASLAGAVTAPLDYLGQALGRTGQYKTLDPNAAGNLPNAYSSAVRQKVASDIAGDGSSFGRKAASYLYQGGMSALDTGARLLASGGNPTVAAGLAAMGSFGQTVAEASAQGASPAQAIAYGTVAAGIEAMTEKLPLDELVKTAKGGWKGLKPAIVNVLKQAGVEAMEEEISLIGTTLMEMLILQEKASYNQRIQQLVDEGMSLEDATEQANYELLGEAMDTAIVSAISGGLSSAGSSAVAYANRGSQDVQGAQKERTEMQAQTQETETVGAETAVEPVAAETAKASPVDSAVEEYKANGTVTNRAATAILNDAQALEQLTKETGLKLPDTASGKRNAVKDAVVQLSKAQDASEIASATADSLIKEQQKPTQTEAPDNAEENRRLGYEALAETMGMEQNAEKAQKETAKPQAVEMDHGAVGAAEQNFSGKQAFNELLSDENAQPDRPDDVRPMEIPKKDAYGRNVSETAANLYGAEVTPDKMADTIQELVGMGALGFDTRTNEESLKTAAESITKTGMKATEKQITNHVANRKLQDGDIEKALLLYSAYANKSDQASQDMAAELVVDLATMANMTGRNLQLFKLIRKLTPQGQLMATQKTVQRYVDQLNKKRGKNNQIEIDISQELKDDYLTAAKNDIEKPTKETARKKAEIEQAIYLSAASQIKATFAEKWNAWRYMCMLGNVKTNVRNIGGNIAQVPYTDAKRIIGAAFEKALPKEQRTKAVLGLSENDRALKAWASEDAKTETVNEVLKYSAKLGDDLTSSKISDARRIFDFDLVEKARKLIADVPAGADMFFKNIEYTKSLAGFMKARGYTFADIENGNISEAVLNEGRAYAIQEAMKATFNDANAFSDFVSNNLRYKGNNPVGKALNALGEGVLPFRRTPANVAVRMVEYSPANIARSVWNMATNVKNGDMSAATAIDQMAAGLTGTGAMMLGALLASGFAGFRLRGSDVDEDEKRQGHQKYSIEFSINGQEYSYTVDWAAPAVMPLFVGANVYDLWQSRNEDTGLSAFTSAVYAGVNMLEPMLSLSCMSSLQDAIESGKYAEDGTALYALVANVATSYFTQGIPALFRQASQAIPENKQQTFANSSDPLLRDLQKTVANIPFAGYAFKTDKVSEWGEKEDAGNVAKRVFNAFFNPGTGKKIDTGNLETEINRLSEAQTEKVSPPTIDKTISYTDKNGKKHENQRLTEEEYETLRTVQGQTAADILNKAIESKDYEALPDSLKAKVFDYAYSYAREKAREAALEGYEVSDNWMKNIEGNEAEKIITKVAYGTVEDAMDMAVESFEYGNTSEAVAALEAAYEVYKSMSIKERKMIMETASGRTEDFLLASAAGIKADTFVKLYEQYNSINKSDMKSAQKAQKWAHALQQAREDNLINDAQLYSLKTNMGISSGFTVEASTYDNLVDIGLDAADADSLSGALSDLKPEAGSSSVRTVQKMEAAASATYLTEKERIAAMKTFLTDSQSEKMDKVIKQLGLSAEAYAAIYRTHLEDDKKAEEIQKYVNMGYSRKEAELIYSIYNSKS